MKVLFPAEIFGNRLLVSFRKLILKSENNDGLVLFCLPQSTQWLCDLRSCFSKWLLVTTMLNSIFDQRIILMNKHSKVYYVTPILKNLHIILSKNGNRHGWDGGYVTRSSLFFTRKKSETHQNYISVLFEIYHKPIKILLKPTEFSSEPSRTLKTHKHSG